MSDWAEKLNLAAFVSRLSDVSSQLPAEKIRFALLLVIAVAFLQLMAHLAWFFVPVAEMSTAANSASTPSSKNRQNQRPDIDVKAMQAWHLFGSAEIEAEETVTEPEVNTDDVNDDAKKTRLQLTLFGIIQSSNPAKGQAIIDYQGKSELYKVGDPLPVGRNVSLAKVLVDRAIIDNRGNYEALFLDEEAFKARRTAQKQQARQSNKKVLDRRSNRALSASLAGYRNKAATDPSSLLGLINFSLAKDTDGNVIGYRLRPGSDKKSFTDAGLRSGDIATSLNGYQASDPDIDVGALYQEMLQASQMTVDVKRGNETLTLVIGIGE